MEIIESVKKYVKSNDKIIAAVSGGVDSMVMLDSLIKIKADIDFDLSVITIEHGIRGKESQKDAKFVADFCEKNNIICKVVSIDVPKIAQEQKQTIEEAARNQRYKIFESLSGDAKIFLAHHASDQVETVLMHIFRGSGVNGAIGIKNRDNFVRPFLNITKNQILSYAKDNNIKYVVDSTNDDTKYTRNFVRKEIIPKISKIYPNFESSILKFASICEEYEEVVSNLVKNEWFSAKYGQIMVSNDAFLQNNLISNKVINIAYNKCGEYSDLEKKHVELIIDLFEFGKIGSAINIPHGVVVEKRAGGLYFYKNGDAKTENIVFAVGVTNLAEGFAVRVEFVSPQEVVFGEGLYADYSKIPAEAVWRLRENGDMFEKLGSSGKKKLNDYYTDKKLTLKERDNQFVLAHGSNVLLVLDRDVSNLVKIDSQTEKIVKISLV